MSKRKYVVLLLLTLVSISLTALVYSNLVQAQSTVTKCVSFPASAFNPDNSTLNNLIGSTVKVGAGPNPDFYAPVQLSDGATVTNLTFYWYDDDSNVMAYVDCYLHRYNQTHNHVMANCWSDDGPGNGFSYDDTIVYATPIDNSRHAHYLRLVITGGPTRTYVYYATIEYTLPIGVGGYTIPVDKLSLLAPYLALIATIILAASISVAIIKYRKKQ